MENDKLFEAFTISELIRKQINGELSPGEQHQLDLWAARTAANQKAYRSLKNEIEVESDSRAYSSLKTEAALQRVMGRIRQTERKPLYQRYNYIGAAAALLIISTVTLLLLNRQKEQHPSQYQTKATADVSPGSNKAFLTLADGKKISLSDSKNGLLANQSGISTTIDAEGIVTYKGTEGSASANAFNIIETPKGGVFQVRLPDGSKVWLNAASSLKYPISFGAFRERKVELTGEAYFEVAHNKELPFRVVANGQTVEVLGTHFNINSYTDEGKTTTTLEEGSVKVTSGNHAKIIKPGEQTILGTDGNIDVRDADMQTALAWKNGKIQFKDADIKTIMRQVSRWYNIDVEYKGAIPERAFNGGVSRTSNLSSLLKILELNNIHFEIEKNGSNKKLIVKP